MSSPRLHHGGGTDETEVLAKSQQDQRGPETGEFDTKKSDGCGAGRQEQAGGDDARCSEAGN